MPFDFKNLDKIAREIMMYELIQDEQENNIYFSKRFNDNGRKHYVSLLKKAIEEGNEITLANSLRLNNCFAQNESTKTGLKKIPTTAPELFAEGEFNRYYIRGMCRIAIKDKLSLEVYRAKQVANPRSKSQQMIGKTIDPDKLYADLKLNIGVDTALGIPPGPNSGLSVKLQ